MNEIELIGLDGGNLLGYLAALGTLRVLTLAEPEAAVRMSWLDKGWWRPVVHHSRIGTSEELVAALSRRITPPISVEPRRKGRKKQGDSSDDDCRTKALDNASGAFSRDFLDMSLIDFRRELEATAQEPEDREVADFLTALGSDCFAEKRTAMSQRRRSSAPSEPETTKGSLDSCERSILKAARTICTRHFSPSGTIRILPRSCAGTRMSIDLTHSELMIPQRIVSGTTFAVRTG